MTAVPDRAGQAPRGGPSEVQPVSSGALNIREFQARARRYLPKILYDFVDGGVEDEYGLQANVDQYRRYRLLPRYLVDVRDRKLGRRLLGQDFALPFGIAPTGYAGLLRPGADLMLARTAASHGIPFVLSGASVSPLEEVAAVAPGHTWFQLYGARDSRISHDLLARAWRAGIRTVVVTVDCPVAAKRERDVRNGFGLPVRLTSRLLLDLIGHPRWCADYLMSGGMPHMGNWTAYAPQRAGAAEVADLMNTHFFAPQTWDDLAAYRERWMGKMILKGVLHPADATKAVESGMDGIILSNHGGRQLDAAATALDALALIPHEVKSRITVMIDGGVRRGSDIVIALCLGAQFVFAGRAPLYGVIAGAEQGAREAIRILAEEVDAILAHIGCNDIETLGRDLLVAAEPA